MARRRKHAEVAAGQVGEPLTDLECRGGVEPGRVEEHPEVDAVERQSREDLGVEPVRAAARVRELAVIESEVTTDVCLADTEPGTTLRGAGVRVGEQVRAVHVDAAEEQVIGGQLDGRVGRRRRVAAGVADIVGHQLRAMQPRPSAANRDRRLADMTAPGRHRAPEETGVLVGEGHRSRGRPPRVGLEGEGVRELRVADDGHRPKAVDIHAQRSAEVELARVRVRRRRKVGERATLQHPRVGSQVHRGQPARLVRILRQLLLGELDLLLAGPAHLPVRGVDGEGGLVAARIELQAVDDHATLGLEGAVGTR